ncbi:hypothetical protein [Devosia sp. SL43]|uniref:hypothetical protein n=1 Tax=Devosia sp. SL43 TaxID=2806348 RepID=UPI001F323355|nr:hypothetical protein [Devosia sp. SL43]
MLMPVPLGHVRRDQGHLERCGKHGCEAGLVGAGRAGQDNGPVIDFIPVELSLAPQRHVLTEFQPPSFRIPITGEVIEPNRRRLGPLQLRANHLPQP